MSTEEKCEVQNMFILTDEYDFDEELHQLLSDYHQEILLEARDYYGWYE